MNQELSSHSPTEVSAVNLYERIYKSKENQLTKALLHLIDAGGMEMVAYLSEKLGIISQRRDFITIDSQPRYATKTEEEQNLRGSIPDGIISVQPLKIVIESKIVKNAINKDQLEAHIRNVYPPNEKRDDVIRTLLYLTPDDKRPQILDDYPQDIFWKSWNQMVDILRPFCGSHPYLDYLFRSFLSIKETAVDKKSDIPNEDKVAIVGGSYAEEKAISSQLYHCQPDRNFQGSSYFAFYTNKRIAYIYKIKNGPYPHENGDDCYDLELVCNRSDNPIINNKRNKHEELTPFTMGKARYAHIKDLLDDKIKTTLDLEERMKNYKTNK